MGPRQVAGGSISEGGSWHPHYHPSGEVGGAGPGGVGGEAGSRASQARWRPVVPFYIPGKSGPQLGRRTASSGMRTSWLQGKWKSRENHVVPGRGSDSQASPHPNAMQSQGVPGGPGGQETGQERW